MRNVKGKSLTLGCSKCDETSINPSAPVRPIHRREAIPGPLRERDGSPCPSDEHATAAHLSLSLAAEPSSGARQVRSAEAPAAGLSRACGRQRRAVESGATCYAPGSTVPIFNRRSPCAVLLWKLEGSLRESQFVPSAARQVATDSRHDRKLRPLLARLSQPPGGASGGSARLMLSP